MTENYNHQNSNLSTFQQPIIKISKFESNRNYNQTEFKLHSPTNNNPPTPRVFSTAKITSMNLNFFNIIMLIGALQGLILSGVLFLSSKSKKENVFIALLTLSISLLCLQFGIRDSNLYSFYQPLNYMPIILLLGIGPLIFFYVKSSTEANFNFKSVQLIHFVPVFIEFLYRFLRFFYPAFVEYLGSSILEISLIEEILFKISLLTYIVFSFHQLKKKKNKSRKHQHLKFLLFVFIIYLALYLFSTISEMIKYSHRHVELNEYYFSLIYLTILNYWLGVRALTILFKLRISPGKVEDLSDEFQQIHNHVIKTKLYLKDELTLRMLASDLGLKEKLVSAIINKGSGSNFYGYINELRIEEVKMRLSDPGSSGEKIMSIAFDSGFNSKSVFNKSFKKLTGITPREYRNRFL